MASSLSGSRLVVRIPYVPPIFDLMENAIQPAMSIRVIRNAYLNFDAHYALILFSGSASNGENLFVVFHEDAIRPAIQLTVVVNRDLSKNGPAFRVDVYPVNKDTLGR